MWDINHVRNVLRNKADFMIDLLYNRAYLTNSIKNFTVPTEAIHSTLLPVYRLDEAHYDYDTIINDVKNYPRFNVAFHSARRSENGATNLSRMLSSFRNYGYPKTHEDFNSMYVTVCTTQFVTVALREEIAKLTATLDYEELPYRPALTQAPSHNIRVYKHIAKENYLILTSQMSDELIRKCMTIIVHHYREAQPDDRYTAASLAGDSEKYMEYWMEGVTELLSRIEELKTQKIYAELQERLNRNNARQFNNTIDVTEREIESYLRRLQELYEKLDEIRMRKLVMETQGNLQVSGLIDMLKNNGTVRNMGIINSNRMLKFSVTQPLLYWDEKTWGIIADPAYASPFNRMEAYMKQMLKDIFETRKYTLLFAQGIRLPLTKDVNPDQYDGMREQGMGIPNPHLHYFNCWGANKQHINRAVQTGDYTSVLVQMLSAVAGINLTDGTVWNKFIGDMLKNSPYTKRRCLKNNETGEVITIEQYRAAYKDGDANKEETV